VGHLDYSFRLGPDGRILDAPDLDSVKERVFRNPHHRLNHRAFSKSRFGKSHEMNDAH
jgi:hypothetical protein